MRCFKKVLSIILSLVFCFTAIYTTATIPAYAATPSNQIINGDFSNGLNNWQKGGTTETTNEHIGVDNGVCYIPPRTGNASERYVYQQISLQAGTYIFSFDADVTFTVNGTTTFCWGLSSGITASYGRPEGGENHAVAGVTVDVSYEGCSPLNPNSTDDIYSFSTNAVSFSKNSTMKTYTGISGNRYVGRIVSSFTLTTQKTVYFCIGGPVAGAYAYIDNVSLLKFEEEGLVANSDFSYGLYGYDMSLNKGSGEAISCSNGVCYIPERTDASANGAYNRWINQKVTLANGKYIFSFDLDMTFSSTTAYAFAYSVKPGTAFDVDLKKPSNTNGTNYTLSKPVISTISSLNTSSEITSVPVDSNKFTKSDTTGLWNYNGTANSRYLGRVSVVVDLNNTTSSTTELLFSIGCYSAGVSAYIDNFSLVLFNTDNVISNGNFEEGKTGYLFADDPNTNINVYDDNDKTRPGYGAFTLDGKAAYIEGYGGNIAYAKKNNLQYKINNLPAGKYSVNMDVLLNNLNTSAWATLGFGVTNAFDTANGRAYSKNIISESAVVAENETQVTIATSDKLHRVPGNSLTEGWHDLDVSLSFTITEATTVYLFVFCDGTPANSIMNATAYVDNISIYESAKINYSYLNVADSNIDTTITEYMRIKTQATVTIPQIPDYNIMGYRIGTDDIVFGSICEFLIVDDENISFLYALKGDLNDDLSIDDLDFSLLQKCILEIDADYNIFGAKVNDDNLIDIVDLVALEIKIEDL